MALSVGETAPDFSLPSVGANGLETITLSSFKGSKNVVLLFFPAAFTGVCTEQMCDMTGFSGFEDLDAEVIGISADTAFAQAAWAKQENIGIRLVSDYQKQTIQDYGVVLEDLAGHGPGSKRAAFVIDKSGKLVHVEVTEAIQIKPNVDIIMDVLRSL
ncbi:MAG: peroxiredoxin [Fimbriimonadaceae bacterium]